MLSNEEIKQLLLEKSINVASKMNLEIFDIYIRGTRKNKVIEIVIDNPNDYVSIDDCERFSRAIEPWIDELDLFESSYDLVVSSPGLDRKLRDKNDYIRFKGHLAKFILKSEQNKKLTIIGYIEEVYDNKIKIKEKDSNNIIEKYFNEIDKANLEIEL